MSEKSDAVIVDLAKQYADVFMGRERGNYPGEMAIQMLTEDENTRVRALKLSASLIRADRVRELVVAQSSQGFNEVLMKQVMSLDAIKLFRDLTFGKLTTGEAKTISSSELVSQWEGLVSMLGYDRTTEEGIRTLKFAEPDDMMVRFLKLTESAD